MKRVAIYVRVSTPEQALEGQSIPAQTKALHDYAIREGWEITAQYVDRGESAKTADRPEFQRMIKEAKQKPAPFDIILVHKLDRFARNREDSIVYKSLLRREYGIDVISAMEPLDDSPVSRLLEGILESVAEFYSLNLAQEVLKGMTEAAHQGKALGEAPIGYLVGKDGKYEIVPEEAAIIKWIFEQYTTEQKGTRTIAIELRERGAAMFGEAAAKYKWSSTSVLNALKNYKYTGAAVWNKEDYSEVRKKNDITEWIIAESAHDPIIDKKTWDEVQKILKSRRYVKSSFSDYLLRGIAKCGICGGPLTQANKSGRPTAMRCSQYVAFQSCKNNGVIMHRLEEAMIDYLRSFVSGKLDPGMYNILPSTNKESAQQKIEKAKEELASIDERFERQMIVFESGLIDLEQLTKFKERLEKEKRQLDEKLLNLKNKSESLGFNTAQLQKRIKKVIEQVTDEKLSVAEKRKALSSIVDAVFWNKYEDTLKIVFKG